MRYNKRKILNNYIYKKIDENEIELFIGLNLYIGLLNLPKKKLYLSESPFYKTLFPQIMSRNRYDIIKSDHH